jgi:hypothetical protein
LVINVNHALGITLQTGDIARSLREDLYEKITRLIVIYGDESWTLTNKTDRVLMKSERKILRKMLGPVCGSGTWRRKMQKETHTKYKSPYILSEKVRRLEWFGRVLREDGERTAKKLLEGTPRGGRKKGRPGLRRMRSNWT